MKIILNNPDFLIFDFHQHPPEVKRTIFFFFCKSLSRINYSEKMISLLNTFFSRNCDAFSAEIFFWLNRNCFKINRELCNWGNLFFFSMEEHLFFLRFTNGVQYFSSFFFIPYNNLSWLNCEDKWREVYQQENLARSIFYIFYTKVFKRLFLFQIPCNAFFLFFVYFFETLKPINMSNPKPSCVECVY